MKKQAPKVKPRPKKNPRWFLYLLECADGSFYTGITTDLSRRLKTHREGKASRYTRSRLPVTMIYSEPCRNHSRALKREYEIKSMPRRKKEKLAQNAAK